MMNLRAHLYKLQFSRFDSIETSPSAMIIRMYLTNKPYKELYVQLICQLVFFLLTLSIVASVHQAIENRGHSSEGGNGLVTSENLVRNFSVLHNVSVKDLEKLISEVKLARNTADDETKDGTKLFLEAIILCLSTFFTIGWGHVTPRTDGSKIFCAVSSCVGIPITVMLVLTASKILIRHVQDLIRVTQTNYTCIRNKYGDKKINDRVRKLLMPSLLLMLIVYWLTMSFAIMKIENFSYIDALYYSFSTFSTIGFGDYVQSSMMLEGSSVRAFGLTMFCFLWVLFGVILVSSNILVMCLYQKKQLRLKKRSKKKSGGDKDILVVEPSEEPKIRKKIYDGEFEGTERLVSEASETQA